MRDIFEDFLDRTTSDDFSDESSEVTAVSSKDADPTIYHWRFLFNLIPFVNAHPDIEGLVLRIRDRLERILDMTPDIQEHSDVFILSTYKYFQNKPSEAVQIVADDDEILSGFEAWKQTTVFMFACNCEFKSVRNYLWFINNCHMTCKWQKVTAEQPVMAVEFSNGEKWEYTSVDRHCLNFSLNAINLAFKKEFDNKGLNASRIESTYSFCLHTLNADRLKVFNEVSELFKYDPSDEGISSFLKTYKTEYREEDRKRVLKIPKKLKERLNNISITGGTLERIGTRGSLYLQKPFSSIDNRLRLCRGFHEQDLLMEKLDKNPLVSPKWKMWTWHCGLDIIYIAYLGPIYDRQKDDLWLCYLGFQSQIHYDYADKVLKDLMAEQYDDDWFDEFHEVLVDVANR